jgi:hypothetical protein
LKGFFGVVCYNKNKKFHHKSQFYLAGLDYLEWY